MDKINTTLHCLGICPNYAGHREMCLAIQLTLENPVRLTALVRCVYVPVGEAIGKSWAAVERNLRTVIRRAWGINPTYLQEVAGRPLCQKPETREFLAMVYVYLSGEDESMI